MTELHFLWSGPKKIPGESFRGIETIGADLAARKYPHQAIVFWCLESEKEAFTAHFQTDSTQNVTVVSIEEHIKETEGADSRYFQFIETLKRRAAARARSQAPKSTVHEYIQIKNSFFYWKAQYLTDHTAFMDSTVIPVDVHSEASLFDDIQGFSVPFLYSPLSARPNPKSTLPEPWLMIVEKGDTEATARFEAYLSQATALMGDLLMPEHLSDPPPPAMREELAIALSACMSYQQPCNQWRKCPIPIYVRHNGNGLAVADSAGVKKYYSNTHRLSNTEDETKGKLKGAWHDHHHWLFPYLEVGKLPESGYLLTLNNIDPDKALPYTRCFHEGLAS